jgi:hypothetical protein
MNLGETMKRMTFSRPAGDERVKEGTLDGGRRHGENENPYLAARRTWNDQSAANIASRQMSQLLGVLAMLVALAGVGGAIYIGSQSKFIRSAPGGGTGRSRCTGGCTRCTRGSGGLGRQHAPGHP